MAVLKDDEVDRLERAAQAASGPGREVGGWGCKEKQGAAWLVSSGASSPCDAAQGGMAGFSSGACSPCAAAALCTLLARPSCPSRHRHLPSRR